MTPHSPKQNFLIFQPTAAAELQKHREDSWLVVASTFTLAEMAHLGASTEQLLGARNFIHVFQSLWEKGEAPKRLPVRNLQSYDTDLPERSKDGDENKLIQ